eukprot:gene11456-34166_t
MVTITKDTDRDFFMSPQEAIEYGLVDAIISKPQDLQSPGLCEARADFWVQRVSGGAIALRRFLL